ncbi:MAG: hypothetical protein U1F71_00715 [Verrucomicrobiaceae bacterium]
MKRSPTFALTPQEVVEACRRQGRALFCAGQVLALRELMRLHDCNTLQLAERSRVSYAMIHAVLNVERFPTTDRLVPMVVSLGQEMHEFDLLAKYSLTAEVSL